jgi:protein-S-isoprenylcysteine O-methyltransferase Ste14
MKISITLWVVWYVYWSVSANISVYKRMRDVANAPVKREPWSGRIRYLGLMTFGFALLFWPPPVAVLNRRLWPVKASALVAGLTVQAVGLAFAIWARHTLGTNWSGRITVGGAQELIVRGPYRIVRHPIYSGLLLGILGTAIVVGEVRGFVGLLMVLVAVLIKVHREEIALRGHFSDQYEKYVGHVPALLPRWPR